MKAKVPALLIFMLVFGVFVITQSVDGKWTGEVQGGRGPQAGEHVTPPSSAY